MNIQLYEKISDLTKLITKFYSCKFVTGEASTVLTDPEYLYLWIKTHKSNKELNAGFVPHYKKSNSNYGPAVRITRTGKNTVKYGELLGGNKLSVTHNGIIFIKKPNIVVERGVASLIYKTDDTIDFFPQKYLYENSYSQLEQDFPDLTKEMLTALYYFSINPLPKGVQVEIVLDYIDMAILCFKTLSKRVNILK